MRILFLFMVLACSACGDVNYNPAGPSPTIPTPDPSVQYVCDYLPSGEPWRCKIVE